MRAPVIVLALGAFGCEKHDVTLELPTSGRALTAAERTELQQIADVAFRDVRAQLEGLPPRLTLIVRWDKDVIPETGEGGGAGYPGNIAWRVDPDRDVLATIRQQLRATLFHELHHLARASRVHDTSLSERVVMEGLATAFERDGAKVDPPWGKAPAGVDMLSWTREVLAQTANADQHVWLIAHPDGRRWIGMRVGTFIADRAAKATGKSAAELVFTPASDVVRAANVSGER